LFDLEKKHNIKFFFQTSGINKFILSILLLRIFTYPGIIIAQTLTQTFDASGTFTVPNDVYCVTVQTWGAGGAGGGATGNRDHCGGGGGGGAYNYGKISVTPGSTYNVIVGAGGIGTTGNGGDGGSSSFNGLFIANGGKGGLSSSNFFYKDGGPGGSGGTGGLFPGGNGASGYYSSYSGGGGGGAGDANNGGNAAGFTAGSGGDNNKGGTDGGNGGFGINSASGNGNAGNLIGGGGSGGKKTSTSSNVNGGNGARGQVIVSWVVCTPYIVTITAEYCARPGYVRLTAHGGDAGSTYLWSNGATTNPIDVKLAGEYDVTVTNSNCCTATAIYNISNELVVNGDFSAGYSAFTHSSYVYKTDVVGNTELNPEGTFGIGSNPQNFHSNFWGRDHTTGTGNFMIVNGFPGSPQPVVWSETVSVIPGTTYYFSAWAISLNSAGNYATLQFRVNNTLVGTTAALPARVQNNNSPYNWIQFYGTWTAPEGINSVPIDIVDLQTATTGNDFALDDISFATLNPMPVIITLQDEIKICQGQTLILSPTITGGKPPFNYYWTGPKGFSSTLLNPSIHEMDGSKTGIYQLSVTDGYGCPAVTASVNIQLKSPPSFVESLPVNANVQCGNVPIASVLTAVDYTGPVTVSFTEARTNGPCSDSYTLTRTWTASNDCGTNTHIQTINVTDDQKPVWLSAPLNQRSYCVQDIIYASWNLQSEPKSDIINIVDSTPVRPEYHILTQTEKNSFYLDPSIYYTDNCTSSNNVKLHWSLTSLADGSYITDENGNLLDDEIDAISNHNIRLDGSTGSNAYYRLKYWLEDNCGNISDQQPNVDIAVKPRPIIVKNF
jgi:hypothetical protein